MAGRGRDARKRGRKGDGRACSRRCQVHQGAGRGVPEHALEFISQDLVQTDSMAISLTSCGTVQPHPTQPCSQPGSTLHWGMHECWANLGVIRVEVAEGKYLPQIAVN